MKNKKLRQVLFVRRAFQMTMISVVLVMVISIAIVLATGSHSATAAELCGQVQNLRIEETATELTVRWEPAFDPGAGSGIPICGRFYFIEYEIDGEAGAPVRFHTNIFFTIPRGSCAHHWFGIKSSQLVGSEGTRADIEHTSGIIGNGAVEDLRLSDGNVVWNRPQNSDACTLTFRIDMEHQRGTSTDTTDDLTFPLPTIPCLINRITVTANVIQNEKDGEPRSIIDNVPESSVAPIHGFTNPSHVGAAVKWVLSDKPNECEFVEIMFELNGVTIQREPFDKATKEITATFVGFPENQVDDVLYTARWILGSGDEGDISAPIRFQTVPLTDPTILDTEITFDDGGITISWTQDYSPFFVTGHIVEVLSLGPKHLLPSDCETDTGETYTYPIYDNAVRAHVFPNARPHFTYDIKVTTLFGTLGMVTSDSIEFLTPTDTPGPVILQEVHDFASGVAYAVRSSLSWSIPCDINGPLREFTYELSGRFVHPSDSFLVRLASATKVSDGSTTTFTIETQQLNPFFVNTLVINTFIDPNDGTNDPLRATSQSTLPIQHLPLAYTPPSS